MLLRLAFALIAATLLSACVPLVVGGVATTGLMIEDRRSTGTYVEDESIEWKILNRVAERYKEGIHVNATSYNRHVLLVGQVANEEMKAGVEALVKDVPNVKRVSNALTIGPPTSLATRGNDSAITGNVKTRFVGNKVFNPIHVKVITEANVVYLMGLVTRDEGAAAAESARQSKGVERVETVFEYVTLEAKK